VRLSGQSTSSLKIIFTAKAKAFVTFMSYEFFEIVIVKMITSHHIVHFLSRVAGSEE